VIAAAAAERLLPRDSFWQVFPLSLLALVPTGSLPPTARRLYLIALVTLAGIILTATHDGAYMRTDIFKERSRSGSVAVA